MLLESSFIIIESPIEEVYKIAETYPIFVKFYTTKSIIENNNSKIIVDVGYKFFGIPIYWTGIGKKIKNTSINYTQTKGLLKGMEARWNFISLRGKTKVTIDIELKKSIQILNWFFKKRIRIIIDRILADLKDSAEERGI